jgi:hypothetical protein
MKQQQEQIMSTTKANSLPARAGLRRAMLLGLLVTLAFVPACSRSGAERSKGATASAEQSEPVLQLGHSGWLLSAVFSPDGKQLASGGGEGAIKIWEAETGALLRTLAQRQFG